MRAEATGLALLARDTAGDVGLAELALAAVVAAAQAVGRRAGRGLGAIATGDEEEKGKEGTERTDHAPFLG